MLDFTLGILILSGSALLGWRWYLDRLHPVKPHKIVLQDEWERRFQKLKESVDELTFGGKLRHRKDDEEDL